MGCYLIAKLRCKGFGDVLSNRFDKLGFIALKGKGSGCEADIYFSWRDTDKIISAKHDRREAAGFWRWKASQITDLAEFICRLPAD